MHLDTAFCVQIYTEKLHQTGLLSRNHPKVWVGLFVGLLWLFLIVIFPCLIRSYNRNAETIEKKDRMYSPSNGGYIAYRRLGHLQ